MDKKVGDNEAKGICCFTVINACCEMADLPVIRQKWQGYRRERMVKVSIVIPVYNQERYLAKCMETVMRQTLADIEIICVNDGSTDRSPEMLREYADKDERIILLDGPNGGYGKAMNRGMAKAQGEYIGIVEPDDFVPLEMYEDLYKIASENDLDFVKADFYRFVEDSSNGNVELTYNHLSKNKEDYNKVFNPSEDPDTLKYIMNTWSGIYKREFIEKNNIRHNETPGASFQDNGFYFQTFIFGKRAMIVDHPYYMNRRDNPNSSVSDPRKVYCMNEEFDFIRNILLENPDLWQKFKYAYWRKKYVAYRKTMERISDSSKLDYAQRFSSEFKRAKETGELRKSEFSDTDWEKIQLVIRDPQGYAYLFYNKGELMRQAEKIWSTKSYKLGRTLMKPATYFKYHVLRRRKK